MTEKRAVYRCALDAGSAALVKRAVQLTASTMNAFIARAVTLEARRVLSEFDEPKTPVLRTGPGFGAFRRLQMIPENDDPETSPDGSEPEPEMTEP